MSLLVLLLDQFVTNQKLEICFSKENSAVIPLHMDVNIEHSNSSIDLQLYVL